MSIEKTEKPKTFYDKKACKQLYVGVFPIFFIKSAVGLNSIRFAT